MRRGWMLGVLAVVAAAAIGGYALARPAPVSKVAPHGWSSYASLTPAGRTSVPAAGSGRSRQASTLRAGLRCPVSALLVRELKLRAEPSGETHAFVLTNIGRASCTLAAGAPRLSLIGADGGSAYTPPQTVASHGAPVRLKPLRSASFWVDLLAPQGQTVAGARQLAIAVPGVPGLIRVPLLAADRASQQLVVSALAPGVLASLPRSLDTAARCDPGSLSLNVRSLALAAGTSYNVFILKNTGRTTCSLGGVARLSISDQLGKRLYRLPQSTGSPGSEVDVTASGRASFWVEYTDCGLRDVGAPIPARQVIAIPGITGQVSASGYYPARRSAKCPVTVSSIVGGVFQQAPGFTTS